MSSNIIFEPSSSAVAQIAQLSDMTMDEIKSLTPIVFVGKVLMCAPKFDFLQSKSQALL
jgi:hypothetical protein